MRPIMSIWADDQSLPVEPGSIVVHRLPRVGHGPARHLEQCVLDRRLGESFRRAAELEPDGESALSVMALRHVPEACRNRDDAPEIAPEPKQKSVEMDLGR